MLCVQRRAQQLSLAFLGGTGCPGQLCLLCVLAAVTQKLGFLSYDNIQELGEWLSKQVFPCSSASLALRSPICSRHQHSRHTSATTRGGVCISAKRYPKCNRPVTRSKPRNRTAASFIPRESPGRSHQGKAGAAGTWSSKRCSQPSAIAAPLQ